MIDSKKIVEAVNMRAALDMYGVQFNQHGFALCPFHNEKTASFSIVNNHYHCFGCGDSGDIIGFVMRYFNLSFPQACVKIDNDFALGLVGRRQTFAEKKAAREEQRINESRNEWITEMNEKVNRLIDRRRKIFKWNLIWQDERVAECVEKLDTEIDLMLERIEYARYN